LPGRRRSVESAPKDVGATRPLVQRAGTDASPTLQKLRCYRWSRSPPSPNLIFWTCSVLSWQAASHTSCCIWTCSVFL